MKKMMEMKMIKKIKEQFDKLPTIPLVFKVIAGVYITLAILCFGVMPVFAEAGSKLAKVYMMDLNKYFVIDATRDGFLGMNPMADLANGLFYFHKWVIKLVAGLVVQSYTFDLYNLIEKQFNIMFKPIKVTFYDGFFPIVGSIFIFCLLILFKTGGRASAAFESFVKGFAILIFALWFMKNPAGSMSTMKMVVDVANNELIKNSFQAEGENLESQYRQIGDEFYKTNVVEVWHVFNFSSEGLDAEDVAPIQKKYESRLLTAAPGSEEREKIVTELREEVKINEGVVFFSVLLIMILSIPDVLITLLLSGINFASDGLTLLIALIGPIVFLFALIPSYGSRLFMSWLSKIMFFFGITIATTVVLTYYLQLSTILLNSRASLGGIIGVYFIKCVTLVIAYIFRDKFKFAYESVGHGRRGMERSVQEMGLGREAEMAKEHGVRYAVMGSKETLKYGQKQYKEYKKNNPSRGVKTESVESEIKSEIKPKIMPEQRRSKLAEDVLETQLKQQIHRGKTKAVELEDTFGVKFEPQYGEWTQKVAKYEAGDDPFSGAERREMINDIYLLERTGKDPQQLLEKYKVDKPTRMDQDERREHAEEILSTQLQARMSASETRAGANNSDVTYDSYTVERLRRKEAGEQVFDDKELKSVADGIKKYEKADGDPSRLVRRRNSQEKMDEKSSTSTENNTSETTHGETHTVNHKVKHNVEHEVNHTVKNQALEMDGAGVDLKKVKNRQSTRPTGKEMRQNFKQELDQKKELDEVQDGIGEIKRTIEEQGRGINDRMKQFEGEADHEKEKKS